MKKKTIITVILLAAAVIAVLLIILPVISQLIYHRSWNATVFAWQFDKDEYTTEEAFEEFLAEKSAEHAEPYDAPDASRFSVSFALQRMDDMPYCILNRQDDPERLLVYFAGGSYTDDPHSVHWDLLDTLAQETGLMILVPLYPKLPEADAEASYEALQALYDEAIAPEEPAELLFMGDSAGGGMALSFAMQLRDAGLNGPDRLILLSPWLDVTLTNPDIPLYEAKDPSLDAEQLRRLGTLWAGSLSAADPIVSPLYGNLEDLGRITLYTGTAELLFPDIMALDAALTEAGIDHDTVVQEGMFHIWPLFFRYHIPESIQTVDELITLLKEAR